MRFKNSDNLFQVDTREYTNYKCEHKTVGDGNKKMFKM